MLFFPLKSKFRAKIEKVILIFPFRARQILIFFNYLNFAQKWMILEDLNLSVKILNFSKIWIFPPKWIFLSYFWIFAPKISRICSYIGSEMWWDIHDFHWRDPIVQKVRRSRISDWPGFHICWNSPKTTGFLRDKVTKTPNWPILKEKNK